MEKLLFLLLLLVSPPCFGQISPKLELSHAPGGIRYQSNHHVFNFGDYRSRMGVDIALKGLVVSFDNHVFMHRNGGKFTPTRADYRVEGRYSFGKVSVGAVHRCIHPIVNNRLPVVDMTGGYTRFYIGYGY